jgi:antitoxin (DNA-binding transcriptional repressor) of toxin-antitoxin stability system
MAMNVIQLEEAQKDLERVVHLANDGGPVMIWHQGRIVAELHPHREEAGEGPAAEPKRSREEVFRSMDGRREQGAKFPAAELDELRRLGRRY